MRSMVEGQPQAMALLGCPSTPGCAGGPPPRSVEELVAALSYTHRLAYTRAMPSLVPRTALIPAASCGERFRPARGGNFGNVFARTTGWEPRA